MNSALPKVLHPLGGMPLLHHVLNTAGKLKPASITVVYGHGGDQVKQACIDYDINWVHQQVQNGTGHAVDLALSNANRSGNVLVMYGDVPLLTVDLLSDLVANSSDIAILTANLSTPTGYGRIIRENGSVTGIIEQRDANAEQLKISEINTGILCARFDLLSELLAQVDSNNDQGEIYLTDVVELAHKADYKIDSVITDQEILVSGINNKSQLASMERELQHQQVAKLLDAGVTIMDPLRIDIRGSLKCGKDVVIDVNCIFEGEIELADNISIGPGCVLKDVKIGSDTEIKAYCVIEQAKVASGTIIGPFARLRPGSDLADNVHVGNFVEIKNSNIGQGSKVNHLSYIGDSDIGRDVNIGAGTITCNYDGANKHRTTIEDDVFIGSGNELVAPITIAKGATTGAGSTLSKNVEEQHLAVSRGNTRTIKGWKRPTKKG